MKSEFENFLRDQHSEQYRGCDNPDMQDEDFCVWLESMSVESWIHMGDLYGIKRAMDTLDKARSAVDRLKGA